MKRTLISFFVFVTMLSTPTFAQVVPKPPPDFKGTIKL